MLCPSSSEISVVSLCYFRYEKIMPPSTSVKATLELIYSWWSWYSSRISCHYMDSRISIFISPAHVCCSSSQTTFASYFPRALLFTSNEMFAKRKINGVLILESQLQRIIQWILERNFDK